MNLKRTLLAASVYGAFLLLSACGGSSADNSTSSGGGSTTTTSSSGGSTPPSTTCQSQPVVGGNLSVAQQGPVGVTLVSTGGLSAYTLTFLYDNVHGISTNNPQDKWGSTTLFPPGTAAGASTQVTLQPPAPDLIQGQSVPPDFPKGVPVELWLAINDGNQPGPANSSSTALMGKDVPHNEWPTASVIYGSNSTATVTFFPGGAMSFSVGVTNVVGSGTPSSC